MELPIFIFIVLYIFGLCDDTNCINKVPTKKEDCTDIELSFNNKCCFFKIDNVKLCVPISINSYENYISSKKDYLTSNYPNAQSYTYDCSLNIETCKKIINPTQKLACTGRKMESPYSCCFIKEVKNDKTYKSCYPLDASSRTNIDNFAQKYKDDNDLDEEPSIICSGNFYDYTLVIFMILAILF